MKMFATLSLLIFLLASDMTASEKITNSEMKSCKRNSKDLNQCIVNVWTSLIPKVGEGIPKYRIPPLEPLSLPELKIDKKSNILHLKATVSQLKSAGVSRAAINKLNVDLTDLTGMLSLTISDLNITTSYVMDALLMKIASIKGRGQFKAKISNVKVNVTGKAKLGPKNKHGKSYLQLSQFKLKLHVGDAKGRLKDTTKNTQSKIAAETANVFYEANRRAVLDMLNPTIEEYTESVVKNIFNEVFSSTPYEDMFS